MSRWDRLFRSINSEDAALSIIRETTTGYFIIAAINVVVAFLVQPAAFIDAVVFTALAFWLRRRHSRLAAGLLVVLALLVLVVTVMARATGEPGGRNVILAFIMVVLSIRAGEATIKLQRYAAPAGDTAPLVPKAKVYGRTKV